MQKATLWRRLLQSRTTLLALVLIILTVFTIVTRSGVLDGAPLSAMLTSGFMSRGNLYNVFNNLVIQCIMLCGLTCLLIGGNIDLSVAGLATLSTLVFAKICVGTAIPWGAAAVITLLFGAFCGLINTFLVNTLGFPPFIATIGMTSIYSGLSNIWTTSNNVHITRAGFIALGERSFGVFPALFLMAIVLMAIYQFILLKTQLGRNIYMAGGNTNAARLSGLNPKRIRMMLFINNSVLASLAGLTWSAKSKFASPSAITASGPDMRVIAAAILGGVAFHGGAGDIAGTFVAVLLLNVFQNILDVLSVPPYWNIVAQGALLILALILDYFSSERQRKLLQAR